MVSKNSLWRLVGIILYRFIYISRLHPIQFRYIGI